ncbi:MAG: hypothetical protein IT287_09215 [Bdellovibrionaceae bacterium]|nr:hypothetical protein [Pseudobdellovibrionaceae bacterium]
MKTLFFFTLMTVVSWTSNASTEIIEASDMGRTHIDPITMSTFINYKTNFQYDRPNVSYARCQLDAAGKPINNYFIIKKKDDKGVVQNLYTVKSGLSCEEIQKNDTNVVNCEAHSALEMTISDPDECAQGKCATLSTPRIASTPLPINLKNETLQEEIKKCSPDKQYILIKDGATNKSLVASLADKSHCKLDKRRIFTDGAPWDDGESSLTQIFTSNKNGFYIGEHTHYFYDETKKDWCIHFRPDIGSTAPSCGYNNMTRSIAFAIPSLDKKVQKGVVKLSVDASGNPVAEIGPAEGSEYSKSPKLAKPILKVSLINKTGDACNKSSGPGSSAPNPDTFKKCLEDAKKGRRTVFEALNDKGDVVRRINVAPSYSIGTSEPNTCEANACLQGPKEVLAPESELQCSKTASQPFKIPGNGKEVCYSCNGISSGNCGAEKVVLSKSNLAEYTQKTTACRSTNSTPVKEETQEVDPVIQ